MTLKRRLTELCGELDAFVHFRKSLTRYFSTKEYEQDEIDRDARAAKSNFENLEASLVKIKSEVAAKQKEVRGKSHRMTYTGHTSRA
jgi:hypothetical protein